uniref:Uncharacterized protein n=1 Tax=Branchiostoma floridae TaxID=7739 RepID=C3XSR2_BRAFL|eukprot:XP_002612974.1 hypothetical protein BRAFLDRAFT_74758 [Branchiostoma floridae]
MAVVTGRIGTLDIIAIVCGSLILVTLVMSFVLEAVCGPKEEKGKTNKNKTAPSDGNENFGFQGDGDETARSVEDGIALQQRMSKRSVTRKQRRMNPVQTIAVISAGPTVPSV